MKHTNNTQAKSFEIAHENSLLVPIWNDSTLWMNQKDLSQLFEIEWVKLFCEAEKIFSQKVFWRKQNTAYFEIAGERRMYFRMWFIISMWYRLKKQEATKFIIKVNRIIKAKCKKQELEAQLKLKESENVKYINLLEKALNLWKNMKSLNRTHV